MRHAALTARRLSVRTAALSGAGLLVATSLILAPPVSAKQPLTAHSVTVTVLQVAPSTPARSSTPRSLNVALQLTNTTDQSIDSLTVQGDRGDPISTQSALDKAIASPHAPDPSLAGRFSTPAPVTASLGPHATTTLTYRSSSATVAADAGLCICQNRIYPLYFSLHLTGAAGADLVVGSGQTYIPAFGESLPTPVQVSWLWPIIDRPHRLAGDTLFSDDSLSASVAGGRLDRVLQVVETAGKKVPMTVVIDPGLLDELAVMSTGTYTVQLRGKTVPGTGAAAARAWLARLRAALKANPAIELDFTPPADPDVESLTRNGLDWTVGLGHDAQARVAEALGGHLTRDDIAWPADQSLSADTLTAIVRKGATSVILSDAALPGGARRSPAPDALAALQTPAGPILAAVTSARIQRYVASVLSVGGTGQADLPKLVAQVAVRAVQDAASSHYVLIAPPRYIDPSETASVAILATAHTYWAKPRTLGSASPPAVLPVDHGHLVPPQPGSPALSPLTIAPVRQLTEVVPALSTMLSSSDANTLLGALPAALQRAESTAWRTDPGGSVSYLDQLNQPIKTLEAGVRILTPSSGTYTLAASNSPLPLTIKNTLPVAVSVRVRVVSVNGLPGFTAAEVGLQTVGPGATLPLHIPTHVERTGRFVVRAELYTPSNVRIGNPVLLSVHSTALGTIGVIITVAAAAVLALALLVRFVRRMHNPTPIPDTEAEVTAP